MKTYFVRTNDVPSLKDALGRMIEYVKFLEEETGRDRDSFSDQIIQEDGIDLEIQDTEMGWM